jgi:heme/copper-type cytochrome/quinol oxidase subunit 2/mono/diheme cytochrome c family protein
MGALGSALLLVPSWAWAIPGAGDFTSLNTPTGREMASLYNMLVVICLVIFIIVCAVLGASIALFKRKNDEERPAQVHGNMKIEMGLLIAASLLQVFIGYKTVEVMWYVEKMPEKTDLTIEAIGWQWDWKFKYVLNDPETGEAKGVFHEDLVVPAHTNIRLEISSEDVIHSLFVPELGIKMDAVPGRFNYWWFNADGPINQIRHEGRTVQDDRPVYDTTRKPGPVKQVLNALAFYPEPRKPATTRGLEDQVGYLARSRQDQVGDSKYAGYDAVEYRGMCTELCGTGHYNMYFRVVVMTQASYNRWVKDKLSGGGGEVNGAQIYAARCASCHGAEGQGVGAFPKLAGSEWVAQDEDAKKRAHIQIVLNGLNSGVQIEGRKSKGGGAMNAFAALLNDAEVAAVINHERLSWGNNGGEVDAALVAEVRASLGHAAFPAGGSKPVAEADLINEGKRIYAACSTCHGDKGKGLPGIPDVAGSRVVTGDAAGLVGLLVQGREKHSPMGASMTDRELAALSTYLRTSFGNDAGAVQPDEVERARQALGNK